MCQTPEHTHPSPSWRFACQGLVSTQLMLLVAFGESTSRQCCWGGSVGAAHSLGQGCPCSATTPLIQSLTPTQGLMTQPGQSLVPVGAWCLGLPLSSSTPWLSWWDTPGSPSQEAACSVGIHPWQHNSDWACFSESKLFHLHMSILYAHTCSHEMFSSCHFFS